MNFIKDNMKNGTERTKHILKTTIWPISLMQLISRNNPNILPPTKGLNRKILLSLDTRIAINGYMVTVMVVVSFRIPCLPYNKLQ